MGSIKHTYFNGAYITFKRVTDKVFQSQGWPHGSITVRKNTKKQWEAVAPGVNTPNPYDDFDKAVINTLERWRHEGSR